MTGSSSSQSTQSAKMTNPEPLILIISPTKQHTQSIIILHGRGSTGLKFGPDLLATPLSASETLRTVFPHAKFIFPTAPLRRAVIYKRRHTHQWFDNWHLSEPSVRDELQLDGLRDTSACVHAMLRAEMDAVGARNVVLMGLSQGCAAALIALLTWRGEPFGALVGMCGWLPLRKRLEDAVAVAVAEKERTGEGEEGEDLVETRESVESEASPSMAAMAYLLEELGMQKGPTGKALHCVPVFLGHGTEDDRVFVTLGREAAGCLAQLGVSVHWKEYLGLGHWYSPGMLRDIRAFLQQQLDGSA